MRRLLLWNYWPFGGGAALWLVVGACQVGSAPARAEADVAGLAFFESQVRPVLAEHCYECHSAGAKKVEGGLRLDTREAFLKGGRAGPAVVPGDAAGSLLIKAIRYEDPDRQMPPPQHNRKQLPADAIEALAQWVQRGAPYPETPLGSKAAAKRPWSFDAVRQVAAPAVQDAAWVRTSIDRFILARLEAKGLKPAPEADKLSLIRRATFDLTGLPPTPEEIDCFLADAAPDALAKVVDRLLASPHYGEQWGRHWLDVVRYADTAGDTADYPLPEAWRYRNYVIDAFNADKPYDRFLREQVAGDILARQGEKGDYAEMVLATGYLALSRRFGFDSENYHHLTIQDTIDTLGQSALGLTLGCARCHNHKFDPVSVQDYYGLYGIFESTRYAFPGSEQKSRIRGMVPLVPPGESREKWRQMEAGFAGMAMAPSAVLRSLDEMDGDFEMQHAASGGSYGVLVPPWFYEGKVSASPGAQSPWKHFHPFGGVGAAVAAEAGAYEVKQAFYPSLSEGNVYVNVEFRVGAAHPGSTGEHRFRVGAQGRPAAVEVFLGAREVGFLGGGERVQVGLAKPGEWQVLQMAFDLSARTFSGAVGVPGQMVAWAAQPFAAEAASAINFVCFDAKGAAGGGQPSLDLDNIGVQPEPVAPVSREYGAGEAAALAALRAEMVALVGMDGDLEQQSQGTAPAGPWHPGPNSGVRIVPEAQSPFVNIYAAGSLGIGLPRTGEGVYNGYGNRLPVSWSAATAEQLYVSFDFRSGAAEAADVGTWRFQLGHGPTSAAVQLDLSGRSLFGRQGDSYAEGVAVQPGEWHQVQLVLDLKAKTYTGSVATKAQRTALAGAFASGWDGSIDYLFIDSGGHRAGAKAALEADNFMISARPLAPLEGPAVPLAGGTSWASREKAKELRQRIEGMVADQEKRRGELEGQLNRGPVPLGYAVSEGTPHDVTIQVRGEPDQPGARVPRGFIQALGHAELPAQVSGSGRLELAAWLTRRDHPLTARVMVNRLWQYHFGRGLVKTPNDFGVRSEPPSHPELLDHLATQLMEGGWSIKAMHRLIMLSATWQQSSVAATGAGAVEAYGGFARRRLAAEEMRDLILSVSGELDAAPGREHPFPPASTWGYTQHGPFSAVYEHNKRSVYLMVQRIKRHPFLALFDGADPNASTAQRGVTTVPTQALYFLNDAFVHEKALKFAERLMAARGAEEEQLELGYRLALGRAPTGEEVGDAVAFLAAYRGELAAGGAAQPAAAALAGYLRALFGSNEFLHVD